MIELYFGIFFFGLILGAILVRVCSKNAINSYQSRVLFFPDKLLPCDSYFNHLKSKKKLYCRYGKSCTWAHGFPLDTKTFFMEYLEELDKATTKIDICMYLITYDRLVVFLIHLMTSRGIKIRIITDKDCDAAEKNDKRFGDQAEFLSKSGIEVKCNDGGSSALMHNKFVIVDDSHLLVGSLNWTRNAIQNNHESVIITNDPRVVNKFNTKFNRMWNNLDTHNFSVDMS